MYLVRVTPADVGSRVSLRRRVPGPQPLSDVVGELVDWSAGELCVRTRAGELVRVAQADLVAGKVVPPAAPRRRPPDPPGPPPIPRA